MSISVIHKKKIMVPNTLDKLCETSALLHKTKHRTLGYWTIVFFTVNRSVNLVMYKAFTTFSWYFCQDFGMNYTLFSLIAVMNFPGNLLNILVVPYYSNKKVRYVIIFFELLLAFSLLMVLPWHTVWGLLFARLMTGFAITAARSEVNATIGAFTHHKKRSQAISVVEMSFGFSAAGFLVVGVVLEQFGWQTFFVGAAGIVCFIAILAFFIVPAWYIEQHHQHAAGDTDSTKRKSSKTSYKSLREVMRHKRLQLVFMAVLLNKIARNAFYYTFSKWLSLSFDLNAQQAGYVNLFVAAGCLVGTSIVPILVNRTRLTIHATCVIGSVVQIASMLIEPVYAIFGESTPLPGACAVIFLYFCGCQIWYNNILDIMIGVTPRPGLLPAVNTVLLAYGAFGGMVGTIGSTVWFEWGGEAAIATICAVSNVGVLALVLLLWMAHKRHPYLTKDLLKKLGKQVSSSTENEENVAGETVEIQGSHATEQNYLTINGSENGKERKKRGSIAIVKDGDDYDVDYGTDDETDVLISNDNRETDSDH